MRNCVSTRDHEWTEDDRQYWDTIAFDDFFA